MLIDCSAGSWYGGSALIIRGDLLESKKGIRKEGNLFSSDRDANELVRDEWGSDVYSPIWQLCRYSYFIITRQTIDTTHTLASLQESHCESCYGWLIFLHSFFFHLNDSSVFQASNRFFLTCSRSQRIFAQAKQFLEIISHFLTSSHFFPFRRVRTTLWS